MMLLIEGFDKYGPAGILNTVSITPLQSEPGRVISNGSNFSVIPSIVAPLEGTGTAIQITPGVGGSFYTLLHAPVTTNYFAHLHFSAENPNANGTGGRIVFIGSDYATAVGYIEFSSGGTIRYCLANGTVVGTSVPVYAQGVVHHLAIAINLASTGQVEVYLDGQSTAIMNYTGIGSPGTITGISLQAPPWDGAGTGQAITFDNVVLLNDQGSTNNALLLSKPRVETQFAIADSSVAFSQVNYVLGNYFQYATAPSPTYPGGSGPQVLVLAQVVPAVNMTLNSVSCIPVGTQSAQKIKAVVYSDTGSGYPNALLSVGLETDGVVPGTLTLALSSPLALTADTAYWIGFATDTSNTYELISNTNACYAYNFTYASGPPSIIPSGAFNDPTFAIWGNATNLAHNYPIVAPIFPGGLAYVESSTVNTEDLYQFPNLSAVPQTIYGVKVSAYMDVNESGERQVALHTVSNGTDSTGTAGAFGLAQTLIWKNTYYETDPHTNAAWTASALQAAVSGPKIAT